MDHLPAFRDATRPYPQVPYLGSGILPAIRFHEIPQQQGWNLQSLQHGDIPQGHDGRATASFIQDWLYLGLLCELSSTAHRKKPHIHDFVRNEGPNSFVTSTKLDEYVQMYVSRIFKMGTKKKSEASRRLRAALDIASRVVAQLWSPLGSAARQSTVPVTVTLSIMILGSSIDSSLTHLNLIAGQRSWKLADAAKTYMAREGWCRRDMALAESALSEVSMYCASHLQRNTGQGGPGVSTTRHDRCSENACEVNQVDEDTYQTAHVHFNCRCQFWKVNEPDLVQIIQEGRIPYIQLKLESGSGDVGGRRRVVPSLGSHKDSLRQGPQNWYVIFSHVWSDGLGNPRENALPMCQLERFYDMLEDSPWQDVVVRRALDGRDLTRRFKNRRMKSTQGFVPPGLRKWNRKTLNASIKIWIDTLCVPIAPHARQIAISMLQRYYSFAAMTVVLDKSLYSIPRKAYSENELLLRVGLSSWMSRCWTMQEAIISGGELTVRFADGWLPLLDLLASLRRKSYVILNNTLHDKQRSKSKMVSSCVWMVGIPLYILGALFNPLELLLDTGWQLICCGLCTTMATKKVKEDEQRKEGVPLKTSARLLEDSKQFFMPIAAISKTMGLPSIFTDKAKADEDSIRRVIMSWNGLRYRNTSRPSDRFLNFAFGCAKDDDDFKSLREVLQLPAQQRLRAWYLAHRALPCGLLFLEGARMNVLGFRWAPTDIHPSPIEDESPAICMNNHSWGSSSGPEGSLRIEKPALLLEQNVQGAVDGWRVVDHSSGLLHIVKLDWDSSENPGARRVTFRGSLAIILLRVPKPEHRTVAAVVENIATKPSQNSGSFVCRAMVTTVPVRAEGEAMGAICGRPAHMHRWIIS